MSAAAYRLVTFDVYSALFDIAGSLTPVVARTLGSGSEGAALVSAWRRKQMEYALISNSLLGPRIPFATITRRALDDTLSRLGLAPDEADRAALTDAWLDLTPWPEAPQVLESLKTRGHTLGLLSNGDTALLQALLKRLPPVLDHVFSSEQAGYYKPHASVYAVPLQALQLRPADVLHVAGSPTDVLGTKAAGLACAWSNRRREPHLDPGHRADYDMPDLHELLEILN